MAKRKLGKAAARRIERARATKRRREWCVCGHHKHAHEGNKTWCIVQACTCDHFTPDSPTP
jgi:hypothetical protein